MECSSFKPPHQLQACTETYQRWKMLYAKQPTPGQITVELKDNCFHMDWNHSDYKYMQE
jgi:hypothetical protein